MFFSLVEKNQHIRHVLSERLSTSTMLPSTCGAAAHGGWVFEDEMRPQMAIEIVDLPIENGDLMGFCGD